MNRIHELINRRDDEEAPYGDLYIIETPFDTFGVDPAVARYIERRLDEPRQREWLIFRDRTGARVRVRTQDIRSFQESTARTRARGRRQGRAYRREDDADRSREDDSS
jgi:hypothetical protein